MSCVLPVPRRPCAGGKGGWKLARRTVHCPLSPVTCHLSPIFCPLSLPPHPTRRAAPNSTPRIGHPPFGALPVPSSCARAIAGCLGSLVESWVGSGRENERGDSTRFPRPRLPNRERNSKRAASDCYNDRRAYSGIPDLTPLPQAPPPRPCVPRPLQGEAGGGRRVPAGRDPLHPFESGEDCGLPADEPPAEA
jgi:hypothetical protein